MSTHEKIDYVEFPARDIKETQAFFSSVFGWEFRDYGPDYCDFSDNGINGGFYRADLESRYEKGSTLIVFYSENLEGTLDKIEKSGGTITRSIFSFPGGRRFHFIEPSGNEFGVWSDK